MQGQERAPTLQSILHSIYWQQQAVSRSSEAVLVSSTYFCSSSSKYPLEEVIHKQEKCSFSVYPHTFTSEQDHNRTILSSDSEILGRLFSQSPSDKLGKGTYVDLVKVKTKVTHLGYHH